MEPKDGNNGAKDVRNVAGPKWNVHRLRMVVSPGTIPQNVTRTSPVLSLCWSEGTLT